MFESGYHLISRHKDPKPCNSWVVKSVRRFDRDWVECDRQLTSFQNFVGKNYSMLEYLKAQRSLKCEELMVEKAIELAQREDPDVDAASAPKRAKKEMVDHIEGGHGV